MAESMLQAGQNDVSFTSEGETLKAHLFLPEAFAEAQPLPAVIVIGPWTQVKEQTADAYARRLAQQMLRSGMAFDQGASRLEQDCVLLDLFTHLVLRHARDCAPASMTPAHPAIARERSCMTIMPAMCRFKNSPISPS